MAFKNRKSDFLKISAAWIVVVAALFFVACSKGKGGGGGGVNYSHLSLTQHTWEVTVYSYSDEETGDIYNLYITLKFNADGTGIIRAFINSEPNEHPSSPVNFRYSATESAVQWIKGDNAQGDLGFETHDREYIISGGDPATLTIPGNWLAEETGYLIPPLKSKR